jgi:hypothetical protein
VRNLDNLTSAISSILVGVDYRGLITVCGSPWWHESSYRPTARSPDWFGDFCGTVITTIPNDSDYIDGLAPSKCGANLPETYYVFNLPKAQCH